MLENHKVDLQIQGAGEMTYYFEGIAWFFEHNPILIEELLDLTRPLKSFASFSMVFAILFYRALLSPLNEIVQKQRMRHILYLAKGFNKLIE